ncbi:MAG: hypothetical protein ACKOPN_13800 [Prochlorococcaceae cyanobacterium]
MTFDPRSLERLRDLGRSLPKPLPTPEPAPPAAAPVRQHRVETEQDPEQLFRELMQASNDGTVPPHLLERLRQLEASRPARVATTRHVDPQADGRAERPGRRAGRPAVRPLAAAGDQELYEAFADLLGLEGEGDDPIAEPRRNREPDDRLRPKPAIRPRRPGED